MHVLWTRRLAVGIGLLVGRGSCVEEAFGWWATHGANRGDLADEGELSAAAVTGEGCDLGKLGSWFAELPELGTDEQSDLSRRATKEAVVADAGKAFGQDVEQPAPNEFVRVQGHDSGPFGGATGPAEADPALSIVAEEALGGEGAALNVASQVTQGGLAATDVLELDIPCFGRAQDLPLGRGEIFVDLGVLVFEGAEDAAAEALGERAIVDEEVVLLRIDELACFWMVGNGGDDEVEVGMVLDLPPPGVQDAGKSAAGSLIVGGDDITQCSGTFPQEEIVEDIRMGVAEASQLLGDGEGDHEVGHGQEAGLLTRGPDLLIACAALRAGAMIATVVGKVVLGTAAAAVEPRPHGGGAAGKHAADRPVVGGTQMLSVSTGVVRPMLTEQLGEGESHEATNRGSGLLGVGGRSVGAAWFVIVGEGVEGVATFLFADLGDVEVADGVLDGAVPQVAGQLEDGDSTF